MQYEVKSGESIYDVTVKLYGSVSYCVKLCDDNGITLDSDINHLVLKYDDLIKGKTPVEFRLNYITQPPDNNYFIKKGQSIYDLALMFGYGIDDCVGFINSQGFTLDTTGISGNILVTKIKTKLSQYVTLNNLKFSTSIEDVIEIWDGDFIIWDGIYILRGT